MDADNLIMKMYDVAEDWEASIVEELLIKIEYLWRCSCGWSNHSSDLECDGCGLDKPVLSVLK